MIDSVDYSTFFSTVCLMNTVFVGLFLAAMMAKDNPLGIITTWSVAGSWFLAGCLLPCVFMVNKVSAHSHADAAIALILSGLFFFFAAATVIWKMGNIPAPRPLRWLYRKAIDEPVERSTRKRKAELVAEAAELRTQIRALQKENRRLFRLEMESGGFRGLPSDTGRDGSP